MADFHARQILLTWIGIIPLVTGVIWKVDAKGFAKCESDYSDTIDSGLGGCFSCVKSADFFTDIHTHPAPRF